MDPRNPKTWRVLIVEDDDDNTELAQQVLSFHGAQVRLAENGADGMMVLSQWTPDLILMDLAMPVMDGWQMFRKVRENPGWNSIVIIAVSAHAMGASLAHAYEVGFDGYITKPYVIKTFIDTIAEILEKGIERNE